MTAPRPPLRHDVLDAIDHATDGRGDVRDFVETDRKRVRIEDLPTASRPEWRAGELTKMRPDELREELSAYRGPTWARMALRWIARGQVPTVVVVTTPEGTDLADGRGRVSVLIGLGKRYAPASFWAHRRTL